MASRILWRSALVLVALGGVLWAWTTLVLDHEQRSAPRASDETVSSETASSETMDLIESRDPIKAYLRFVKSGAARVGLDRDATSRAVVYLSGAITALADADDLESVEIRVALLDLSARGRTLSQVGPDRLTHADIAREALVWAASLLTTLQERQAPMNAGLASRVSQLDAHARAIRADEPLSAQHQALLGFFEDAADVVQRLAAGTPRDKVVPAGT